MRKDLGIAKFRSADKTIDFGDVPNWGRKDGNPAANCLPIDQVMDVLLLEDTDTEKAKTWQKTGF